MRRRADYQAKGLNDNSMYLNMRVLYFLKELENIWKWELLKSPSAKVTVSVLGFMYLQIGWGLASPGFGLGLIFARSRLPWRGRLCPSASAWPRGELLALNQNTVSLENLGFHDSVLFKRLQKTKDVSHSWKTKWGKEMMSSEYWVWLCLGFSCIKSDSSLCLKYLFLVTNFSITYCGH